MTSHRCSIGDMLASMQVTTTCFGSMDSCCMGSGVVMLGNATAVGEMMRQSDAECHRYNAEQSLFH